jgi:hypothetical protein
MLGRCSEIAKFLLCHTVPYGTGVMQMEKWCSQMEMIDYFGCVGDRRLPGRLSAIVPKGEWQFSDRLPAISFLGKQLYNRIRRQKGIHDKSSTSFAKDR